MKFLEFLDARSFGLQAAERRFEILKFLSERHFGLRTATTEFLNFTPALRNGFRILKLVCEPPHVLRPVLTRALRRALSRANKVEIEAGRGCSIAEKRRAVLAHASGYLNSARRYIARFCSAAARYGYKVGREEKFSKFDFTNALLNFISLPPRKFKSAFLKFSPAPSRNGFEILKFVPELSDGFEILKFTPELRKFKPAPAMCLNFALNSAPQARAAKFENGVKFEGAAKFKRGAR